LDSLLDWLRTPLSFILVLGVLVFVHEMGHYLAARWRGVHVEAFSIGFGKAIHKWTDRRGTEWRLSWLPLGGYVKLHGQEDPNDVTPEQRAAWRPGQTFHEKPVRDRAIVIAAGPVFNFVLAILLFAGLYMTAGQPLPSASVGTVAESSAAAGAGLRPGDRILALDGQSVDRFEQIQRYIQPRAGQPVELRISRDGAEQVVNVTPAARESNGATVGVLGVTAGAVEFRRLDPITATLAGVEQTIDVSRQTLVSVWEMLTGNRGTEELGGVLRIAQISGQVTEMGVASTIMLIAVLSVNLGLINLFPVPVLDGGHLVFHAAEAIRGRPVSPQVMEYSFRAGFVVIIALFVFSTFNDVRHIGWLNGLFG
jgi:regulator of sigma E protease